MPADLRCVRIEVDGEVLQVVSHALSPEVDEAAASAVLDDVLGSLTPAQREVARLVVSGLDNTTIARLRGTSPRTVTKQLEGIFRRLGVGSRRELVARCLAP